MIQIVMAKQLKEKQISINDTTTYQQQTAALKKAAFTALAAHIQQNCEAPSYPFYLFILLEHLAIMWYLVHPRLNVYRGVYLFSQATSFMKILNPHEFMIDTPNIDNSLILVCGMYLLLQLLLASISVYATLREKSGDIFKYLRKIVNYQFLFTAKTLSGPMLALVVNVIYCDSKSPYHLGQTCYDKPYVIMCAVAALMGLLLLIQILLFSLIYYIRNPLNSSCMGVQNRYYVLSKSILKIMMPLYFAVDPQCSLSIVYKFAVTGLLGFYIFWHRLFSVHSYNQKHFYVEYFIEGALLWMAASNLIYYYASNGPVLEEFSIIYTIFSAAFVAGLMLSIEARVQQKIFKEFVGGKVKKQNMEKLIFVLIDRVLYCTAAQSRIRFKTYFKLLVKNGVIPLAANNKKEDEQGGDRESQVQVYRFLSTLLQVFLSQNNSTMLKVVRCHLSCLLGQRSYGIHQSLQLQQQRLSLVEQLMLFQFRRGVNLFENQSLDKQNRQYVKFYRFHEGFGRLEVYVQACAKNNAEYWEQLCEPDPSLAKLRNLATLYNLYEQRITDQYAKITQIIPESMHATTLYLSFLSTAGNDVRLQTRIKEKLSFIFQNLRKSSKISSEILKQDQGMSIITLDTIGNNIGMVLNSNSHVKELLGYERAALVGKNITKLMPKIYTQLHNQFLLSFIRSEHSHQTSVKLVTALNCHSLLVQINLSVRILSSSQSDLAIVGFMKRLPTEQFVGLMMYSINDGQVHGIDQHFMEMMNRRLSGKNVVQQEVRLSVLVPELNMELLQKEKEQETVLEMGNSVDEWRDAQTQKRVLIRLKNVKVYEGVKLGFLEIVDLTRYRSEAANSKFTSSFGSRISHTSVIQIIMDTLTKQGAPRNRKASLDNSISVEKSHRAIKQFNELNQDDSSGRQAAISKRLQQFVQKKEGRGVGWALKILYTVCVLGCLATALFTYFSHSDYIKQKKSIYLSLNQTINVANAQASINIFVSKIWNTRKFNCQSQYQKYIPILNTYIIDLKNTYSQLTTTLGKYEYPLQYNQHNYYNISFSNGVNGQLLPVIRNSTFPHAISNYITAAIAFTNPYINNTIPAERLILQMQAIYVEQNGEQLLPDIAISAMNKYYAYFMDSMQQELRRMVSVKALLMVVIVVCFVCILLLAHHLDKVNLQVAQVYSNVKLNDVGQMLARWNRFLAQRGLKLYIKQRTSSLLKLVTAKAIDRKPQKESFPITVLQPRQQHQNAQILITEQPLITQSEGNQERLMVFSDQQGQDDALVQAEHALLTGKEKEPTINIDEQRSNQKTIIALVVFFCVFGAVATLSYIQIDSNATLLKEYIHKLKIMGEIKKTVNFIDYYAYRVTLESSNARVKSLLSVEIGLFFRLTQQGYVYLGDHQLILKDTYSIVQTIQQWLTVPNVTNNGILSANYTKLDDGLQKTISDINQLDSSIFFPQFIEQIQSADKVELIFTLTLILLMCLSVWALHTLHLGPIRTQGRHSLNMLRILPAYLLQRNPNAMKVIATT